MVGDCVICGRFCELQQDHDHKTGTIRDRICQQCNSGLGCFQDSTLIMSRAAQYLDKWKANPAKRNYWNRHSLTKFQSPKRKAASMLRMFSTLSLEEQEEILSNNGNL